MRTRLLLAILACSTLSACSGLKEALTAHVDVAARAVSQELPVTRLATLFGEARIAVEPTKENAEILANIWADYHRLAYAGARGDSLIDKVEVALASILNQERIMMYQDSMQKTMRVDPATEAGYNAAASDVYAARHILFRFPDGATDEQMEAVRRNARSVRPQITSANFADMAKRHSGDEGSASQGGDLGAFARNDMVPEFSNPLAALRPGEISDPVESSFGVHIIQRLPYIDAKDAYEATYSRVASRGADSTWRESVAAESNLKVKDGAGALAKAAVKSESQHRKDKQVLATFKGGDMTVAEFLQWLQPIPPQYQIKQQIAGAADSIVSVFVKGIALQEIFLKRANDAKMDVTASDKDRYREEFKQMISMVQQQLGVAPEQLADSAKTTAERERLAAARVESMIDRFMAGEGQPVGIPAALRSVLDSKYDVTISNAGIERAVEEARKMRQAADAMRFPESGIPIPGAGGGPPPPEPER